MTDLTKHEELILLAILKLGENAYGVTIRRKFEELAGKSINYGSLCNTLYVMVKKGLISSAESGPDARPGGRRKVIYSITGPGMEAVRNTYELQKQAWDGIADIIYENK